MVIGIILLVIGILLMALGVAGRVGLAVGVILTVTGLLLAFGVIDIATAGQ